MIEGLAKAVVEPLAARWRNTALGTSLTLWLAALLVHVLSRPEAAKCAAGARSLPCRIADVDHIGPALLLVAGFATAIGTAFLAAGVAPGLFTLLTDDSWRAGPAPVAWAGSLLVRRHTRLRTRLSTLDETTGASALADMRSQVKYAELRARYPLEEEWPVSPSACGNALAAVSERLNRKLGLDLTVVWGPLLAILPEGQYSRLVAQSSVILGRCQQLLIAVGGLALAPLFPLRWALAWSLACLLAALAFRHGLLRETMAFGAEVHTVVVAHRIPLYAAYGLPAPVGPEDEKRCGEAFSGILRSFDYADPPTGITYDWQPPAPTPPLGP
ncbi:hypothetical protein [Streptomyces europaeiscabiei]|uniref:hypothetical protein n=1 Tax=Streptomyces europaeiscabiei TaxID=146819 RepID=UPI0029B3D6F0|nr:hypothetical protein [Streptomyces europaeiscabiei]MDX3866840.1 hypothetical protein [Streptomyces europaeiscabiei]MDX3873131.1 hypothetical protein [Streptomyces europaeiscabiei]